jgi:hypothetical protein
MNSTEPSPRAMTKSSIVAFSNAGLPRIRSMTIVVPSSGVRKRSARPAVSVVALVGVAGAGDHVVAGAVAEVRPAGDAEALHGLPMLLGVGRLEERALVLVFVDAEPRERPDDPLGPLGAVAGGVGVFDAQHESAAVLAGVQPVVQRRSRAADVEHAGRRRREAHAGLVVNHVRSPGW